MAFDTLRLCVLPQANSAITHIYQVNTIIPTGSVDIRALFQIFLTYDEGCEFLNDSESILDVLDIKFRELALLWQMYFGVLKRIRQCGHRSWADADRRCL